MKKNTVAILIALTVALAATTAYAQYRKGFVVVSATENSVRIKDQNGEEFDVPYARGDLEKGHRALYDKEKHKVRKQEEGC